MAARLTNHVSRSKKVPLKPLLKKCLSIVCCCFIVIIIVVKTTKAPPTVGTRHGYSSISTKSLCSSSNFRHFQYRFAKMDGWLVGWLVGEGERSDITINWWQKSSILHLGAMTPASRSYHSSTINGATAVTITITITDTQTRERERTVKGGVLSRFNELPRLNK